MNTRTLVPHLRILALTAFLVSFWNEGAISAAPLPGTFFSQNWNRVGAADIPSVPFGGMRLWDTGTTWKDLETSSNSFNWTPLTNWLAQAGSHDVLYTFGKVPVWAGGSTNFNQVPADFNSGNNAWKGFVTNLVQHSLASPTARIKYYELWNEPSITSFWAGSAPQMATMAQQASSIIRSLDTNALVVGPSPNSAGSYSWITNYWAGGGSNCQDIVGYHLYLFDSNGQFPGDTEAVPHDVDTIRTYMTNYHVGNLPIWFTEGSWGDETKTNVAAMTPDDRAAYLAQDYLLLWSKGIPRFYWYSWDNSDWGTLWSSSGGINSAGIAYGQLYGWLVGSTGTSWVKGSDSTWTCSLSLSNGYQAEVLWNSTTQKVITVGTSFNYYQTLDDGTQHAIASHSVTIGNKPILIIAITPPPAPTSLVATGGTNQVSLSWHSSAGATSYNLKRSTTSGGPYTTITNLTSTSYLNTGLTAGTSYYYVVSALDLGGEGANSAQVSAITAPSTPTGLTATGGTNQVSVAWNSTAGASSYNVKRSTTSGGPYTTITNTTSTAVINTGLSAGTSYYYVVSAVNAGGESANAAQVSTITAPSAPTGLSASGGVNQASLNWTGATGASSYNVKRSTTSGGPYSTITNTTSTAIINTGLSAGTSYYFVVSALDAGGESSNSAQASATTIPAPPTGLTAVSGDAQVQLSWSGATGAVSYNVKRSLTSGGSYATLTGGNTSSTSFTDSTVTNGTTFYYEVSALNSTGESANSASAGATPPLIGTDIGIVGLPGSFTASVGTYSVNGAGANIYQTNDSFYFAYRAWTGDVELVTHVLSVSNTSIYAKAGLMIRQDLTTNSPTAVADVTPGYGIEFIRRYTTGGVSTNTLVTNLTAPYWVKLVRTCNTISSYRSVDGVDWVLSGSDVVTMSPTIYVGLIVTSQNTNELCTATFDNFTTLDPWASVDIGATGATGGATVNPTSDTFTVWGAGSDVFGTNDEFQYVYQPMYTNGQVVVQVLSVQNTAGWAKGGVMIRQSLTTNSIHALADVSATNGIEFNRRLTNGGSTIHTFTNGFLAPYWVMLARTNGTNFTASRSPDGVTWTIVGSDIITMTNPVYVGLIVCSHTNGVLCTNVFDNLTVTPGP